MSNDTLVDEARDLLSSIETLYPFVVQSVSPPDSVFVIAKVSDRDGKSLILPHVESQSMLVSQPEVFEFIARGPELLARLLERVESTQKPAKSD